MTLPRRLTALLSALLPLLTALSASAADTAPLERRLIVGLVEPASSPAQLARRLRHAAGVPVRGVRELAPRQVALVLRCISAARCDAAQARLAAATSWIASVDLDALRTLPTRPTAESSR
jgi:hypothetical protein